MRQVAAAARQPDVARAQGLSPALLGRWQRQALAKAVPSSAEREGIKRLRAEGLYLPLGLVKTSVEVVTPPAVVSATPGMTACSW